MDTDYKVWVGCLACYNAGTLVGAWFAADECPQDEDEFADMVPEHDKVRDARDPNPHEEIWVFDHENSPVDGEYGPVTAHEYAELLESISDPEAWQAWRDGNSSLFNADNVQSFSDQFRGRFEEPADYIADYFDESELPDWAKGAYWDILRSTVTDMELGGDITVHELGYQDFAIFDNHA